MVGRGSPFSMCLLSGFSPNGIASHQNHSAEVTLCRRKLLQFVFITKRPNKTVRAEVSW
ncbi:unnamed protein product [Ixodes pacificus]